MSDVTEPNDLDEGADGQDRINKRDFIRKMATEADLPLNVTAVAYEAFVKTLLAEVRAGRRVNLTGFGRFTLQRHKGHSVHFGAGVVDDYTVLRFSATQNANEFIDPQNQEVENARVPGTRMIYTEGEIRPKKRKKNKKAKTESTEELSDDA